MTECYNFQADHSALGAAALALKNDKKKQTTKRKIEEPDDEGTFSKKQQKI